MGKHDELLKITCKLKAQNESMEEILPVLIVITIGGLAFIGTLAYNYFFGG